MSKGYMYRDGSFCTNWEISDMKVFLTKKALKEYFKNIMGFQCYRSKRSYYAEDEEIYENQDKQYGYEIITVEIKDGIK